jgi:diguanylate cyclase (GGDEF)-like protein/PAS domain S-box-containing protein
MTDQTNSPLRTAAEAQLSGSPETPPAGPVAELLHELQVHQIELEMQNETLRKTELALAESRDRYRDLYEFAPVGYLTLSAESVIEAINLTGARLLGAERNALLHHRFAACIAPEDRDRWLRRFQQIKARGEAASVELVLQRGDGSLFQAQLDCVPQEVMRSGIPGGGAGGTEVRVAFSDISERKRAEAALQASETKYRLLFDLLPVGVSLSDPDGGLIEANPAGNEILGLSLEQHRERRIDADVWRIIQPDGSPMPPEAFASVRALAEQRVVRDLVMGVQRSDGGLRWLSVSAAPLPAPGYGVAIVFPDITALVEGEKRLALERQRYEAILQTAQDGYLLVDADGRILDINEATCRMLGYAREELLRLSILDIENEKTTEEIAAILHACQATGGARFETVHRTKAGQPIEVEVSISRLPEQNLFVSLMRDISDRKRHQEKLEHIAHFDVLTGLPNRLLLADRIHQAMVQTTRHGDRLAVVYLDLDGFKAVNDQHGHNHGDRLLVQLGQRMRLALRDGDTLARLGGDEFVALMLELPDKVACVPILERLLAAASEPVILDGVPVRVSASMGVSFYPQREEVVADQLIRQADQAMYQAKQAGKNRYHLFDSVHDEEVHGHHESLESIRQALQSGAFILHYQPKVNMRSGAVIGVEALIRWNSPVRGLLLPGVFLPVVDQHPLGIKIGQWVIHAALAQIEAWRRQGLNLPVSINIDATQLHQPVFTDWLQQCLAEYPSVQPGDLEIEVLESIALDDIDHVSKVISRCAELGVSFALDDFGTGYSSLTYLKRLPANLLKIDQSFVRDMLVDPEDLAILDGVISLAGAFRRQVIAEGVESLEDGVMLLRLGCTLAQGYAIARPMPAEQIPDWINHWQPPAVWRACSPVSRDDTPILFAMVEHQAWVRELTAFLNGKQDSPPQLDSALCRFGHWLQQYGRARYSTHPALPEIDRLHEAIHQEAHSALSIPHRDAAAIAVQASRITPLFTDLKRQIERLLG